MPRAQHLRLTTNRHLADENEFLNKSYVTRLALKRKLMHDDSIISTTMSTSMDLRSGRNKPVKSTGQALRCVTNAAQSKANGPKKTAKKPASTANPAVRNEKPLAVRRIVELSSRSILTRSMTKATKAAMQESDREDNLTSVHVESVESSAEVSSLMIADQSQSIVNEKPKVADISIPDQKSNLHESMASSNDEDESFVTALGSFSQSSLSQNSFSQTPNASFIDDYDSFTTARAASTPAVARLQSMAHGCSVGRKDSSFFDQSLIMPCDVIDYDRKNRQDPAEVAEYAMDIFQHLKEREGEFHVKPYMHRQPHLSALIRTIIVDWLVQLHESFELNHETLYLTIKVIDIFLSRVIVRKRHIQLVASAAMLLASKYDVSFFFRFKNFR